MKQSLRCAPPMANARLLVCRLTVLLLAAVTTSIDAAETAYYRQPAIHGDTVVFVAEGDLWSAPLSGGPAVRLTTHPAAEARPAISPDGKFLAFTARFEGPTEVYLMPRTGGRPRRLTFDAAQISHVGWTPDGRVLVGTDAYAGLPSKQLVALDFSSPNGAIMRKARCGYAGGDRRACSCGRLQAIELTEAGVDSGFVRVGPGTGCGWHRQLHRVSCRRHR